MNSIIFFGLAFLIAASPTLGFAQDAPVPANGKPIDFAHEIAPIFKEYCVKCHVGENRSGGFSVNTREELLQGGDSGAAIEVASPDASLLIEYVLSEDEATRMPPEGERVPSDKVALLRRWIAQDLPWESGFAFVRPAYEPPLKPRIPELPQAFQGRNHPIDRIIDRYTLDQQRQLAAPIDDSTFLRRASLDLIGLLPDPTLVQPFAANLDLNKREQAIERLLADDVAYAEHWLTFWNDLLRNDYDGTGFITGGRTQISSWLYDALTSNKPYDQFVRELVAPPTNESRGFIDGIKWRGEVSAGQTVEIQFAQSVSQSLLGINLKCASCHDSFIDRWKLDEAYGLAAIYADEPLEIHRCEKPMGTKATAKWLFPELGDIDANAPPAERLKQLAALLTHPENGRLSRTIVNRLWHRMMGRGIVHPTDAMQTEPWNADLLDFLASDFAEHGYDLKHTLRLIATSQAYQSRCEVLPSNEPATYQYAGPRAKRMTAEQFMDSLWQITGTAPQKMDATFVRGLEHMMRASLLKSDPLMRTLGRPNRDQIVSMRPNDLSTLEAIDLENGEQVADLIHRGATNLLQRDWSDPGALVKWLFLQALSREPTEAEFQVALESLGNELTPRNVEDLVWAVVMLPEYQIVR